MSVWIKRGACLSLALLAIGCGPSDLPTAPDIPKDFKPEAAAPAGVLKQKVNSRSVSAPGPS